MRPGMQDSASPRTLDIFKTWESQTSSTVKVLKPDELQSKFCPLGGDLPLSVGYIHV